MTGKANVRQRALAHLRHLIYSGRLAPGSHVSSLALARELGVSRMPVREAINQLESEGLVDQIPRLGAFVRVPDRQGMVEIFEARQVLEGYAAALASRRITPRQVSRFNAILRQMRQLARQIRDSGVCELEVESSQRLTELDIAFHQLILETAGNRQIQKIVGQFRLLTSISGLLQPPDRAQLIRDLAIMVRGHYRLLDAVRSGRPDRASRQMVDHIALGLRTSLAKYDRITAPVRAADHSDSQSTLAYVLSNSLESVASIQSALTNPVSGIAS